MSQATIASLVQQRPDQRFRPPADLVVYVNSAAPAAEAKEMVELLSRQKVQTSTGGPLFLSITSKGDWATGKAFVIGQSLTLAGKRWRSKGTYTAGEKQKTFYLHSTANIAYLQSHQITLRTSGFAPEGWYFPFTAKSKDFVLLPLSSAHNRTPYRVMQAPVELMRNHDDIFNEDFENFLTRLVTQFGMLNQPQELIKGGTRVYVPTPAAR